MNTRIAKQRINNTNHIELLLKLESQIFIPVTLGYLNILYQMFR